MFIVVDIVYYVFVGVNLFSQRINATDALGAPLISYWLLFSLAMEYQIWPLTFPQLMYSTAVSRKKKYTNSLIS